MNRNKALAWCVHELKEWPVAMTVLKGYQPMPPSPEGWEWVDNPAEVFLRGEVTHARITKADWRAAKATCIAGDVIADALAAHTPPHHAVNSPKHYQLLPGVEVYDIRQALAAKATEAGATLDQFSDYDRAIEYLLRMWEKNGKQDAEKAAWYLNKLIGKLS